MNAIKFDYKTREKNTLEKHNDANKKLLTLLKNNDFNGICQTGIKYGYGKNTYIREKIYYKLLGINSYNKKRAMYSFESLIQCEDVDSEIIHKDALRTFNSSKSNKNVLLDKQKKLELCLNGYFSNHKNLHYLQGFNEILGFLTNYFGEISGLTIFSAIEKKFLRDYSQYELNIESIPPLNAIKLIILFDKPD